MTFRHGAAERAAAVIWLAASSALATARWWLAPVMLLPLLAVAAAFRRSTRVDAGGITISALLARRRVPWESVSQLRAAGPRRVVAVLTNGRAVRLPAVRPADLARLAEAGAAVATPGGPA